MKVSIVIPLFNKAPFIGETIQSVLNQNYSDFKLIIVDDGSIDGSQEIVRSFMDERISFFQNEKNMGTAAIANKMNSLCDTKYIVRIDADDLMLPNRIPIQLEYMNRNSDVVVSSGSVQCFGDDQSIWSWPESHDELMAGVLFRSPIIQPASIINRENWMKYDFKYDESGPNTAEDWLMWYKMGRKAKIGNVKDVLINYRVGEQNISGKAAGSFYSGRKFMYDYIFKDLNLPPDKIDLHFLTRPFFLNPPLKKDLKNFREWLNYLKGFNEINAIFSKELFEIELEKKWNQLFYHLFQFGREIAMDYLMVNKGASLSQIKYFLTHKKSR